MKLSDIGVMVGTGMIRIYQLVLSPWLGGRCRFYPSCSSYALEAIQTHGLFKGSFYAIRRILCCHPFHPGGVDLVPPRRRRTEDSQPHDLCRTGERPA